MNLQTLARHLSVRSAVVVVLVAGSLGLAVIDKDYRPLFARLADVGLGGYLGQLIPRGKENDE